MAGIILKKIFISGRIKTLTGLHIGGSETGIEIGGLNSVIRDSISGEPYLPGSSLKGKMRSLLEKLKGEYEIDKDDKAGPSTDPAAISAQLFGIPADDKPGETEESAKQDEPGTSNGENQEQNKTPKEDLYLRASRLIVRDAFLTDESKKKLENMELELPFTEVKTETSIDRITSKANPRSIERVPRDAEFELDMILTLFEGDEEKELLNGLFTSMILLQEDYLGGHGSRGSGKIKITITGIEEKTKVNYLSNEAKNNYSVEIPAELQNK